MLPLMDVRTRLEGVTTRGARGAVLVLATLCGCSEQAPPEPPENRDAPGFMQIHEAVLATQCSQEACHSGVGIAKLTFDDPQAAYDHLLQDAPTNNPALTAGLGLVVPGDPDASFLLTKLEMGEDGLAAASFGGPMPLGAVEVPGPQSLAAIREWIEAGAPFDGRTFDADLIESSADSYVDCDATDEAGMHECFGPAPDPSKTLRLYTPPMLIPAGEEVLMCTNLSYIAPADALFHEVRGGQMRGGHHAGVFVSIQPSEDYTPTPCGPDTIPGGPPLFVWDGDDEESRAPRKPPIGF